MPISGRFRAAARNLCQIVCQKLNVASGAVFEHELESAGCADSGDRRRREAENNPVRQPAQSLVQARLNLLKLLRPGWSVSSQGFNVTKKKPL